MATTTFVNYTTTIDADWLNEVDALVHDICGGSSTLAELWTNIGTTVNIDGGAIDGTIIGASSAAALTCTTFNSTSIADTGSAVTITPNTIFAGNVGIGISPAYKLHVKDTNSAFAFGESGGEAYLFLDGSNGDFAGADYLYIKSDGTAATFTHGAQFMSADLTGNTTFSGNVTVTKASPAININATSVNGSLVYQDNGSPKWILYYESATGNFNIYNQTTTSNTLVLDDTTGDVTFSGNVSLADNKIVYLGGSNDGALYHSSTFSTVTLESTTAANNTLQLLNSAASQIVRIRTADSGGTVTTVADFGGATPAFTAYYGGSQRFQTISGGINLEGPTNPLINFASNDYLIFYSASNIWEFVAGGTAQVGISSGMVLGAPTGSYKGTGTLNAVAVYDDNVLLTDYVFDYHLDGQINSDDAIQAEKFLSNTNVLDLDYFSDHWKQHRHLPSLPSRDTWEEENKGIGYLAQRLWETVELQAVHIDQLNTRLKQLEAKHA